MSQPRYHESWKADLLGKDVQFWEKRGFRRETDVWIRLIYWFAKPDWEGEMEYWGEYVFLMDKDETFAYTLTRWVEKYRPGYEPSQFNFDWEWDCDEYVNFNKTPRDYGIHTHATIIVEDDF